jgi:hypothetical protein
MPCLAATSALSPFKSARTWSPEISMARESLAKPASVRPLITLAICTARTSTGLTFYPAGDVVHFKILVANMGFVPFGLAIDKTRGFIYVSNGIGNSIAVYNTTGTLLDTIKNRTRQRCSSMVPLDSSPQGTLAKGHRKSDEAGPSFGRKDCQWERKRTKEGKLEAQRRAELRNFVRSV